MFLWRPLATSLSVVVLLLVPWRSVIGGVSPIGHVTALRVLIDADLMKLDGLWAAAGHPHAVFNLTPAQLLRMTAATVADVALR